MSYFQLLSTLLSIILTIGNCDITGDSYANDYIEDRYPNEGANPEKPLPNERVYDSHEPRDFEPDWRYTVNSIVSTAAIVQVVVVAFYILISRVCCIKIRSPKLGDEYPSKPWNIQNEQSVDLSERRYLSKEDAVQSDGDFDTDPEDLEVY